MVGVFSLKVKNGKWADPDGYDDWLEEPR
jgi:hypothetical protein